MHRYFNSLFYLLLLSFVLGAVSGPYAAQAESGACRNSQILAYIPSSGSTIVGPSEPLYLWYVVHSETIISSLDAKINGKYYPVEYLVLKNGKYRVRVLVPDTIQGPVYVELGAGSVQRGSCNEPLQFVFTRGTEDKPHHAHTSQQTTATAHRLPTSITATERVLPAHISSDTVSDVAHHSPTATSAPPLHHPCESDPSQKELEQNPVLSTESSRVLLWWWILIPVIGVLFLGVVVFRMIRAINNQ